MDSSQSGCGRCSQGRARAQCPDLVRVEPMTPASTKDVSWRRPSACGHAKHPKYRCKGALRLCFGSLSFEQSASSVFSAPPPTSQLWGKAPVVSALSVMVRSEPLQPDAWHQQAHGDLRKDSSFKATSVSKEAKGRGQALNATAHCTLSLAARQAARANCCDRCAEERGSGFKQGALGVP